MAKRLSLEQTLIMLDVNGITNQEQREYVINYVRNKVADHEVGIVIYYMKEGWSKEKLEKDIISIAEKLEKNEDKSLSEEVR